MGRIPALLFLVSFTLSAQEKVDWKPELKQAQELAKQEGKLLFIEAYLPTCPACKAVEPFFSDKEVAGFYNSGFVNYKMDLSVPGTRRFLDDKGIYIPSFPQFLFFDGDGNLVHQAEVGASAISVLNAGKTAANPEERSSNYANRFENGDRDFNFLVKYGVFTRVQTDTLNNRKVADALFEAFPKENLGTEASWALTKKVVNSTDNGFFKYWINHISTAAALEESVGHKGQETQVLGGIIQNTILSSAVRYYSFEKLQELRKYMELAGVGQFADTYLWSHETKAKVKEGKPDDALQIGNRISGKFKDNAPSQIYITNIFNDIFPDASYTASAKKWLGLAKPNLKENNLLAEYYYELARVNQKEAKLSEAKTNATEALKFATKAKLDPKKFSDLLTGL